MEIMCRLFSGGTSMKALSSINSFVELKDPSTLRKFSHPTISNSSKKNERKLLKFFLVNRLHKFFITFFYKKFQYDLGKNFELTTECYEMDGKIIQVLLNEIVETGEYTLEGVATYTRIPLDIIVDAACGTAHQLSITPWTRIVDLYMQVRPTVYKAFFDKLVETVDKQNSNISSLLNEI